MHDHAVTDAARKAPAVTSGPALNLTASVAADTTLRCLLALAIVRGGMRVILLGAHVLSPTHPARHAYGTAVIQWRDRTRKMPWRGFVPTDRRLATVTQAAWLILGVLIVNAIAYMVGLPHVPMDGLLSHHVPHLSITASSPR